MRASLLCALLLVPAGALGAQDEMVVPGGTDSVARLLGNVDTGPERFATSLNRRLLSAIRGDHDVTAIETRARLVAYLETVAALDSSFDFPLAFDGSRSEDHRRFEALAEAVGLQPVPGSSPPRFELIEGEFGELRQRAARALGWNLLVAAAELSRGKTVRFELTADSVDPLLPLSVWSAAAGRVVRPDNALLELVGDQRIGLLAEGLRRLSGESRSALDARDLRWLHENAAVPFYRYASSFELRDGRLPVAGGEQVESFWRQWVGASPSNTRAFMRGLLGEARSGKAHVWSALVHADAATAAFYGAELLEPRRREEMLTPFLRNVAATRGLQYFAAARGTASGLDALIRGLPADPAAGSATMPDPPGLWCLAALGDELPVLRRQLDRFVERGVRTKRTAEQCLGRLMVTRVPFAGFEELALHRWLRQVHRLDDSPAASAPRARALALRAGHRMPALTETLVRLRLEEAKRFERLILVSARVARRGSGAEVSRALVHYQGGLELLAALRESERLPPPEIRAALDAWLDLHAANAPPSTLMTAQADWLADLLGRVDFEPSAPGRGALEQAWLASLSRSPRPEPLRFMGLDFVSGRAERRAGAMLRQLRRQRLPSLHRWLELRRVVADLARAAAGNDADAIRRLGMRGRALVEGVRPGLAEDDAELVRIFQVAHRTPTGPAMTRLAEAAAPQAAQMARKLTPFWAAHGYLLPLAELDSVLLTGQDLIRGHRAFLVPPPPFAQQPVPGSPWRAAQAVSAAQSQSGAHVAGYLGSVDAALIEREVLARHRGSTRGAGLMARERWWLTRIIGDRSSTADEATLQRISALDARGRALVDRALDALDDPTAMAAVRGVVPASRLEAAVEDRALIAPSERILIALRDEGAPSLTIPVPTPAVNGRSSNRLSPLDLASYESLERETPTDALVQREWVDFHLTVVAAVGRRGWPPAAVVELERYLAHRARAELRLEHERDWENVLRWLDRLDDEDFERGMRWCLEQGSFLAR